MARPRLHDDELRDRLLSRASHIVSESGVGSLSLRALATAEGTSTSAVYSLFGGKPGLLGSLYEAAFSSFGQAQRAVPVSTDPAADISAMFAAYWDWAMSHPLLYAVMFGGALAGFAPDLEQSIRSAATIDPLAAAVRRATSAGLLVGDVDTITMSVWAGVHGVVSLQLANCSPYPHLDSRRVFDAATAAVLRGFAGSAQRIHRSASLADPA